MTVQRQHMAVAFILGLTGIFLSCAGAILLAGADGTAVRSVYFIGFTGMTLAVTFIYMYQSERLGLLFAGVYVWTTISLLMANVLAFLALAEALGIEGMDAARTGVWPVLRLVMYGVAAGLFLTGISIVRAKVLPRFAGVMVTAGALLLHLPGQIPFSFNQQLASPAAATGSLLIGAGFLWIAWEIRADAGPASQGPLRSAPNAIWGPPFVVLTAVLLAINAYANNIGDLSVFDGVVNLISVIGLVIGVSLVHTAQSDTAGLTGFTGFLMIFFGAVLFVIPAFFISAQLFGMLDSNQALMASWQAIPIGQVGNYMLNLGLFVFGISAVRSGTFSAWAGWLMVVGTALSVPSLFQTRPYFFLIFWAIGTTLTCIGLGRMGWELRKKRAVPNLPA